MAIQYNDGVRDNFKGMYDTVRARATWYKDVSIQERAVFAYVVLAIWIATLAIPLGFMVRFIFAMLWTGFLMAYYVARNCSPFAEDPALKQAYSHSSMRDFSLHRTNNAADLSAYDEHRERQMTAAKARARWILSDI